MSVEKHQRVAVLGHGAIGAGWVQTFLDHGYEVSVWVRDTAKARSDAAAKGYGNGKVLFTTDLAEAVVDVDIVFEATPEDLALKKGIFAQLDAVTALDVPLTSSSSNLLPSSFSGNLPGERRCLVAHPPNPPHLLPVVELVPGPATDSEVMDGVAHLLASVGKTVARLHREVEGYLLNRLQGAMLLEAMELVDQGIADASAIDAVITDGLGRRWPLFGLFENLDLNAPAGFDDFWRNYGHVYLDAHGEKHPGLNVEGVVSRIDRQLREDCPLDQIGDRRAQRAAFLKDLHDLLSRYDRRTIQ